ncbi:nucleotidyltransferase family protein [Novosphingobium sp. RL4]|uniref:nucleotidyltransferase family protein n=1 Tax=Novosphingobium sp. RL4 TaxID=3109595 RepID=UPI002D773052|nr:nucleotidyltransferase family protein [Novosphingobium sp. RL4]WRT95704.1 nucleotidyltransferase family protein [Novosphingobium sp. RL4]
MDDDRNALGPLCQCLRGEAFREPRGVAPDWDGILSLANRTLVTPALAQALADDTDVPAEVRHFLEEVRARTAIRNRRMHEQLREAVAALNQAAIEPILLKGAALLARNGEDCAHRLLTDLDLMVPYEAGPEAVAALAIVGYRRYPSSAGEWQGVNLFRPQDPGGIDLHFRLKLAGPGHDHAALSRSCLPYVVGSGVAALPSPTLLAALFILHDQLQEHDYWRGLIDLRHLLDIARIAESGGIPDPSALEALFPSAQARRALHTQLRTLSQWLGVTIGHERRDWRVSMQSRRRNLQLHRPRLAPILTLLAMLVDPPHSGKHDRPAGQGIAAWARNLRRIVFVTNPAKV